MSADPKTTADTHAPAARVAGGRARISDPLQLFSDPVRRWFEASFEGPTDAQAGGWRAIADGQNTLICAPTGSGKTLAAFLWGIDRLANFPADGPKCQLWVDISARRRGVRLVYVSPLKALSYDIERNLRAPLRGIGPIFPLGFARATRPRQSGERCAKRLPTS